jgi:hypothetical protein
MQDSFASDVLPLSTKRLTDKPRSLQVLTEWFTPSLPEVQKSWRSSVDELDRDDQESCLDIHFGLEDLGAPFGEDCNPMLNNGARKTPFRHCDPPN